MTTDSNSVKTIPVKSKQHFLFDDMQDLLSAYGS